MKDELQIIYEQQVNEMSYGVGQAAQRVPIQQVVSEIKAVEKTGTVPISVTVVGKYKPKKRSNPGVDVYKVSQVNGMIDADYERSVNRQREREGSAQDFKRRESWHQYVSPAFRAKKTDPSSLYLAIQPTPGMRGKSKYVAVDPNSGTVEVIDDITAMEWAYIQQSSSKKVAQSQGLQRGVEYRLFSLNNIAGVTIKGKELMVDNLTPGQEAALKATGFVGQ